MRTKTLVLGASLNKSRYSNKAIRSLVSKNHEVVALGLRPGTISGVHVETEMLEFKNVHTITLYLNPKRQKEYYNYIISLNPTRVIFNPGTENFELMKLLEEKNIKAEVACTLVLLSTDQY